eukprot:TRINITY_DN14955_c0_g1_i1.p1 TRINITY_DN14955_c0_g1~~TRINITY_DN14955_c0_g1_i1.p1  ORF type:complete len:458 (-),score=92.78 TRINITY_DN14955_c0_g1_i1:28-1401(-)
MMNGDQVCGAYEKLRQISPGVFGWRTGKQDLKEEEDEEVPTHLNTTSTSQFLNLSKDKLSVTYIGNALHGNDVGAIQANCPAPVKRLIYYFEIYVRNKGEKGNVSIGFTDERFKNSRQPGWEMNSYGYHGDDGMLYYGPNKSEPFGPKFSTGDTVGAGINYASQEIFFTKNGKVVGTYPKEVKGQLFPTIGLHSLNEKVDVNFGQRAFAFDVELMAREEREKLQSTIEKIPLPHFITHRIVRSYLMHYGYQDTLASLDTASGNAHPQECDAALEDSQKRERYAIDQRKMLRQFIRNGDVDSAFNKLHEWYPQLVQDENSTICFLLHCQKYIEFITQGFPEKALSYARSELLRYHEIKQFEDCIKDCAALLAYEDPKSSSVGYLMGLSQREVVADAINAMILTTSHDWDDPQDCLQSKLEKLLRQLSLCLMERRSLNGGQGEIYSLQKILHANKERVS